MPRVHSSQRQKNKPFKGQSKNPKKARKVATRTKPIAKLSARRPRGGLINEAKSSKNKRIEKIATKNQYLDSATKSIVIDKLKNESNLRIIVLFPGNADADPTKVLQQMQASLELNESLQIQGGLQGIPYPTLQIVPVKKSFIQNKLLLISGARQSHHFQSSILDLLKCADVFCPVLSCRQTKTQSMNLDPHSSGGAFDATGYLLLNMIRNLGVPSSVGIVQDLELHENKHQDKIERLFKRFLTSELGQDNDKIVYINTNRNHDFQSMLRLVDSSAVKQQPWKKDRGFVLVDSIEQVGQSVDGMGTVKLGGYLKGACIHSNQLVHITGFDDFEVQKIEIKNKRKMRKQMQDELVQFSTTPDSLFPFSKRDNREEDIMTALEGLNIGLQEQNIHPNTEPHDPNTGHDPNIKDESMSGGEYEDVSDEDEDEDEDQDLEEMQEYMAQNQREEQKQRRIVEMQMRKDDQLEFEDEVEYAAEEVLREKYKEYQGLKNFKTSEWNHYENLPDEYDRIYTFKHYLRTYHSVIEENQSKGFAYPGFYVQVTIRNVPCEQLAQHSLHYPTILTFLLKHERKMTQLHLRVRRNRLYPLNDTVIQSNKTFLISMGFRRFVTAPIFSSIISGTQKTKYVKAIKQDYDSYFYCSLYYYNTFPPAPVQIYRVNALNHSDVEQWPVMCGQIAKCDPLHIILQRIILTGYPFKINKRRSVVRFMFFNPKDIKYFKPVELRTKMGLKGRIEESLGTHGHMKVLFNDKIKHNDTACMHLYRRVYPEAKF